MSIEILGPFKERLLVVNGWSVPLVQATEMDGGRVFFKLDDRIGTTVEAKDFESFASFIADVVAVCLGYNAHPRGDDRPAFDRVPHPSLEPRQVKRIDASGPKP